MCAVSAPIRILVIDEDPHFRGLVASTLVESGYVIDEVGRGSAAFDAMLDRRYDAVIVNGKLPDMTGIQLIETIREAGDQIDVLYVSEFWRDRDTFRRLRNDLSVSRVLSKPFTPEELVVQVRAVVGTPAPEEKPPDRIITEVLTSEELEAVAPIDDSLEGTNDGKATDDEDLDSTYVGKPTDEYDTSLTDDEPAESLIDNAFLEPVTEDSEPTGEVPAFEPPPAAVPPDVDTAPVPNPEGPFDPGAPPVDESPRILDESPSDNPDPSGFFADLFDEFGDNVGGSANDEMPGFPAPPDAVFGNAEDTMPVDVLASQDPELMAELEEIEREQRRASQESGAFSSVRDINRGFVETLQTQLNDIEKKLPANVMNMDAWADITTRLRTARTAAESYGYMTVGSILSQIEAIVQDITDGASTWSDLSNREVRAVLSEAKALVAHSSASLGGEDQGHVATVLLLDADGRFLVDSDLVGRKNLVKIIPVKNLDDARAAAKSEWLDGALIGIDGELEEAGFEFANELRTYDGKINLPIGFVGSDASQEAGIRAIRSGGMVYLRKPIPDTALLDAVRRLASARSWDVPRAMIISDDDDVIVRFKRMLRRDRWSISVEKDPDSVLERMSLERPNMVLVDTVLPFVSGFDVSKLLRSTTEWQDVPVLFILRDGSTQERLACFQAGGVDCLERDISRQELIVRARTRLAHHQRLIEVADRDPLTGLLTRHAFLSRLRERLAEARRFRKPMSVCLINIDGLKNINQASGYATGDRLIAAVGDVIRHSFRIEDLTGRWEGDRYAVVFLGEESDNAHTILDRALEKTRVEGINLGSDHTIQLTFSCGIAAYPKAGASLDALFRRAQRNLNQARDDGGNKIIA